VKNKPLPVWFVKSRAWICTQILVIYYTVKLQLALTRFLKTHDMGSVELKLVSMGYQLTVEGKKHIYQLPGGEAKFTITRRTVTF
jgi:hypothetical protein